MSTAKLPDQLINVMNDCVCEEHVLQVLGLQERAQAERELYHGVQGY